MFGGMTWEGHINCGTFIPISSPILPFSIYSKGTFSKCGNHAISARVGASPLEKGQFALVSAVGIIKHLSSDKFQILRSLIIIVLTKFCPPDIVVKYMFMSLASTSRARNKFSCIKQSDEQLSKTAYVFKK